MHDEELAACRVRVRCSCHRENAAGVLKIVLEAVCREFALNVLAGVSGAVAAGTAALYHKSAYYSVECEPVIKALVYELLEVCDSFGRYLGIKLYLDLLSVFKFNDNHIIVSFLLQ